MSEGMLVNYIIFWLRIRLIFTDNQRKLAYQDMTMYGKQRIDMEFNGLKGRYGAAPSKIYDHAFFLPKLGCGASSFFSSP